MYIQQMLNRMSAIGVNKCYVCFCSGSVSGICISSPSL